MATKINRGISLIEVLVVIAIIGILISMIMPSIQQVRSTARRASCLNNLKQIGLAMHSYESAHMVLPRGMVAWQADATEPPQKPEDRGWGWGWSSQILPQLELESVNDALDFDKAIHELPNRELVSESVSVALCPDAAQPFTYLEVGNPDKPHEFSIRDPGVALTNYVACAGSFNRSFSIDVPAAQRNGIYAEESKTAFRDISDGTSSTIMVGETVYYGNGTTIGVTLGQDEEDIDVDGFFWDPRWYGAFSARFGTAGVGLSQFRTGRTIINPPRSESAFLKRNAFASNHAGGANMLFADGSVRFLSETIESSRTKFEDYSNGATLGVLQRLTGRNDGLTVEGF